MKCAVATAVLCLSLCPSPATAAARRVADPDTHAAVMHLQSITLPKLFAACESVGARSAKSYEADWLAWKEANKEVVERGEAIVRNEALRNGEDVAAYVEKPTREMVSKLGEMSREQQVKTCAGLLDLIKDEAKHD